MRNGQSGGVFCGSKYEPTADTDSRRSGRKRDEEAVGKWMCV